MSVLRAPAIGVARLRVRPWHADDQVAHITPAADAPGPLTTDEVRRCVAALRRDGYRGAVTAAIGRADQAPFLEAGFVRAERLHLLLHRLDELPNPRLAAPVHIRRGRRRELVDLLAVDHAAFNGTWRLDRTGLDVALSATPTVHLRVARDAGATIGYAICGRAAHRGYVQRLAVHPRAQGQGVGGTLLLDGLRWLRRWGAGDALVNTQEGNDRSLRLYLRVGFVLQPDGLTVLRLDLGDVP
ncbi:MAG: GNAT family N-acetyltransferase [Acidimicrobiales bacterium]